MALLKPMRFKKGDTVYLAKPVKFPTNPPTTIEYHTPVLIVLVDRIFRTYDIEYNGEVYTDFNDSDFE